MAYRCTNLLLNKLSWGDRDSALRKSESVALIAKECIYERDADNDFVDFLETAVVNLVHPHDVGASEVATIGFEGYTGVGWALRDKTSSKNRAFCLNEGNVWRMPIAVFKDTVARNLNFYKALVDYDLHVFNQTVTNMGCSHSHAIEKRSARWILAALDRLKDDEVSITQEDLGYILGASRTSINQAARIFQGKGLISYSRGRIKVHDRDRLQNFACACYEKLS